MNKEKALEVLKEEEKKQEECFKKIQEILKEYGFSLKVQNTLFLEEEKKT